MPSFFKNLGPFKIKEIIKYINCKLSNVNENDIIDNLVSINNVDQGSLSFLYNSESSKNLKISNGTIICTDKTSKKLNKNQKLLIVNDVQNAIAIISNLFYREYLSDEINEFNKPVVGENSNLSKKSIIENGSIIGKNVAIHDGSIIKQGCVIGDGSIIGNNSVISNSIIAENVVIGNNSSIGQTGFGFSINDTKNIRIFHTGRVIIEKNVNIGSNCCIDRGSFSDTKIGENSFIDNLCHIAHNVKIGRNNVFAAMSGIAGSSETGKNVLAGGQVGIAGHIKVGNNVSIAAKSAVMKDVKDNHTVMGNPAIDKFKYIKAYKKNYG